MITRLGKLILLPFLILSACGGKSGSSSALTSPSRVAICDEVPKEFYFHSDEEVLRFSDLPKGDYIYIDSSTYISSLVKGQPVRMQIRENVHAQEVTLPGTQEKKNVPAISIQPVCQSGVGSKNTQRNFNYESPLVLARFGKDKEAVKSFSRKFGFILENGNTATYAKDDLKKTGENPVTHADQLALNVLTLKNTDQEKKLKDGWDSYGFVHVGFKLYEFRASKKMASGETFHMRVRYQKPDADIIREGDIFLALPSISHGVH